MPYDSRGFFYGDEARTLADVTQSRFIEYLAGKLNDPEGGYRSHLEHDVVVSSNVEVVSAAYSGNPAQGIPAVPSVSVLQGKGESEQWGKTIGDTYYKGRRRVLNLKLDCAAGKEVDGDGPPADESGADNNLASFIEDIVNDGYDELWELGLTEIEISPDEEKQRAGEGRNPSLVTYAAYSLSNYNGE